MQRRSRHGLQHEPLLRAHAHLELRACRLAARRQLLRGLDIGENVPVGEARTGRIVGVFEGRVCRRTVLALRPRPILRSLKRTPDGTAELKRVCRAWHESHRVAADAPAQPCASEQAEFQCLTAERSSQTLGACRAWGVEAFTECGRAKIGPSEDSFLSDSPAHSHSYGPRSWRKMDRCGQFAADAPQVRQAPRIRARTLRSSATCTP